MSNNYNTIHTNEIHVIGVNLSEPHAYQGNGPRMWLCIISSVVNAHFDMLQFGTPHTCALEAIPT